jgi:AP2 domain
MKKIKLTQGKFAIVDDDDFVWLNKWKWHYDNGYAARRSTTGKLLYMHREILEKHGYTNFQHTDHINHNGLDNRFSNLRPATVSQNQGNKKKQKNNTSGYKGVSWDKRRNKWQVYIKINGKQKHLGYYDDIEDAKAAYDKSAKELFGEFAFTNERENC